MEAALGMMGINNVIFVCPSHHRSRSILNVNKDLLCIGILTSSPSTSTFNDFKVAYVFSFTLIPQNVSQ